MSSLQSNFNELMERIRAGRNLDHASYEPIYYLIFPPGEILDVKRNMPAWRARLKNDGWDVYEFSFHLAIKEIIENSPMYELWLKADKKSPLSWEKTNQSLANAITSGELKDRFQKALKDVGERGNSILFAVDLEALHPYLRIGSLESQLYGEFNTPTILFYPGVRTGKTRLKFLGFYPEDGNYRSVHVGG